jgi:VCBS repeat-containing protein
VASPGLLANDSDPDNNALTAVKIGDPAHGTVVVNPNGSYVYTPEANYNGPDSFTYAANNGSGNSNTATVSITVNPVDEPITGGETPSGGGETPSGGGGTGSGPVGPGTNPSDQGDKIAPAFSGFKLTNSTFAVNTHGAAETPVAARAKRGTKFTFTLSEASRVVFTFQLKVKGRKVGTKCVRATSKNKKGHKACTLLVRFGSFAVQGKKGVNTKSFSGKIGKKSMKPGKYRASLVATDAAGNKSKAKLLNLKVVKK